ncbi:hypothetical protein DER46DRAFT_672766 [Fusarium sp. MPI-SDFR-AT-0072]|uniref:Uncharacterized protein n=1 Tax=Fusarium oxysporum f. sp. rapae TaxID=485398 RepID=A0A8J5P2G0_FUSOX|nr:hypothetical protein Forpe1208_v009962 [Fusarium oxysporum f. sp. rapae]KAH7144985.1 hypothetical protein DER46DRAFT_672766 [Fusarium sp. MPI-SDFR-AT-0072]
MPRHREICYGLLIKTPGLSFPYITKTSPQVSIACTRVFSGSPLPPNMTPMEVEGNICEFLTECYNNFHCLTICPHHDLFAPPCACEEKVTQYYDHIASSLKESWERPIDPKDIKFIVEAILYARIEAIKKGIKNEIGRADNLILLNAHILVCTFAGFKHSHGYRHVDSLFWTVTGAIEQKTRS